MRELPKLRRFAEALFHHDKRRDYLTCDSRAGGSGDAHFRQPEHSEDKKRIKNYISNCSGYLSRHRAPHVPLRLVYFSPDALKEQPEAEHTDYPTVGHDVCDDLRGVGLKPRVRRHYRPADRREYHPRGDRKRSSDSGVLLSLPAVSRA